jgi:UDP-GlcNAc:undecaprenyl-phosphate GlcNAc-1-phosphate transferase
MFLGFTLATTSICAGWQHYSNPIPTLFAPIVTLSVPIFDITLVTCLRLKNGRMPWHGGKDHSSHRLVAILRGSEKGAVLVLYAIGILSGVLALVVMQNNSFFALIATGLLAIGMIGFGIKLAKVPYNYRRDI